MKSKSLASNQSVIDQVRENLTFDFVKLYNSSADTKIQLYPKHDKNSTQETKTANSYSQTELSSFKRSRSPNKNKRKKVNDALDASNAAAALDRSLPGTLTTSSNRSSNVKKDKHNDSVKSIMKGKPDDDNPTARKICADPPSGKTKKRNKSVSFMLDDAEEVIVKKIKSNDANKDDKSSFKAVTNKEKLLNKKANKQKTKAEKQLNGDCVCIKKFGKSCHKISCNDQHANVTAGSAKNNDIKEPASESNVMPEELAVPLDKKNKKAKNVASSTKKVLSIQENQETEWNLENSKKQKKKKRQAKFLQDTNSAVDGEPAVKLRKKEIKPDDTIAEGLENLNIGDNAHTLSSLLDEMTVTDKKKKRKEKEKKKKLQNNTFAKATQARQQMTKGDNATDEVEKVKWINRKWNKDVKSSSRNKLLTSVLVENLPLSMMCSYKSQLSEHFTKFGTIVGVGVAEAYPNQDPKPVFTTTIYFQDEESATKALEDDNIAFQGQRIRVRRPMPPSETTVVVRTYADVTDQGISSIFSSAGRIRTIRNLIKGKNTMNTVFIEFDGPEAVERALKLTEDVKIGGKKIYVSKFEIRKLKFSKHSENNSPRTEKNVDKM